MNLYIIDPDTPTHIKWVNSQPQRAVPNDWHSPAIPVPIADGVLATWEAPLAKAGGIPLTLDFVLSLSRDIGIGVLAHVIVEWLMANFAGRAKKVVIERMEVSFDRGELTKIVTETIRTERADS